MEPLLGLLVQLVILAVVFAIVWYAIQLLALPPPIQKVVLLLFLLILLVWVVHSFGIFPLRRWDG